MMTNVSRQALAQVEITAGDIDRFIPHQANSRILDVVSANLGVTQAKTVRTIQSYGNSSAATIALSLSLANQEARFAEGEHLLMAAAGAGLIGGALILRI